MGNRNGLTRRRLIEQGFLLSTGAMLAPTFSKAAPESSRVVLVRRPQVLDGDGRPHPDVLCEMLDDAVVALTGERNAALAWAGLIRPDDVVGIKTNVWRFLGTPPALEDGIRTRVSGAGVDPDAIAIDDRGVLRNPVFGRATALINVRPMRTHHWAGLGTCVKNYIVFVPTPSEYHDNACERLGSIWKLPQVANRTRLNVLVMLTPLFHGVGPHHFSREHTWPYAGLLVGREPASVDAVGAAIIAARRRQHFGEDRPISPPPHHIQVAGERYGLGETRLDRIDLVRLGERSGSLI